MNIRKAGEIFGLSTLEVHAPTRHIDHFRRSKLFVVLSLVIGSAYSQQPFDLDTTFRTEIDTWYVNSIHPLPDGKIFVSGQIRVPSDPLGVFRGSVKLLPDGSRDLSFPSFPQTVGGGKITPWTDEHFYVSNGLVRRLTSEGLIDPSFISMNLGPYFVSLQGGDYHVYPDGRVLMSGVHNLHDSIRGYQGLHCLIWFSNEGYLDTTKTHRKCAGSLDFFRELPDGKFIGSLGNPPNSASWEGQPTGSNIIRFHADGGLDTTFHANVWWGTAYGFLPLEDGRVYAAGRFRIEGIEDTLRLVRFMPNGSLDETFNNFNSFIVPPSTGTPNCIYPLSPDRLIITGRFDTVNGLERSGICLIDTAGNVLNEHFSGLGAGTYQYQNTVLGTVRGITPAPDGNWYIWGSYHGYDDGTTNDTLQRMVSRLHGLDVGIAERYSTATINVFPNPGDEQITIDLDVPYSGSISVQVYSSLGEVVLERRVAILLETPDRSMYQTKWIKE